MATIPTEQEPFLGVEHSLCGKRWQLRLDPADNNRALAIAQKTGLSDLVARVLAARGVDEHAAPQFLNPKLRDLMPDPSSLTDMDKAVVRLAHAIQNKENIAIFGDYDVDGAASSALLARYLKTLDVACEIYIPDRIFEGYGPNAAAIEQLHEQGANLLVTVDCGSTSYDALAHAAKLNMDCLVLDHHQVNDELPTAHALVNPNRQDDLSGLGYMCAAGVVFVTLVALNRHLRKLNADQKLPDLMQLLGLVSLATVCDVVPLKGLNRAFVTQGLGVIRQGGNAGLAALGQSAGLNGPVSTYHLGFMLGPRINAGGRIGDAALGSRLLCEDDPQKAAEISQQLEQLNKERQAAEAVMLEEAISEAEMEIGQGQGPSVLVTARGGWHPGIVGLLASRLKDRFKRPAIAIAFDGNGKGSGSCRSFSGIDIGAAIRDAVDEGILDKGGGHAMAAGLTIQKPKLGDFRAFLEKRLARDVANNVGMNVLKADGALSARGATIDLYNDLESAGPYGASHPQPLFVMPNHTIKSSRIVGRDHVSVELTGSDGARLRGIAFRVAEEPLGQALLNGQGNTFHLAGTLNADHYRGAKNVQLRVIDAAPAR